MTSNRLVTTLLFAALLAFTTFNTNAQTYAVQWTNLVGVSVKGTTLTSTATTGWGNSGASSVNVLPANTDGWVEFPVGSSTVQVAVGLSSTDPDATIMSINYAYSTYAGRVYENGVLKISTSTPVALETIRIERIAGVIYYKRNGVVLYTSTQTSTSALLVDMAINTNASFVSNVTCSFGAPAEQPLAISNNVYWQNLAGAAVNASNAVTKNTADGWTSGASSLNTLNPNTNGWAQFTIDNITQQKAFGLSRTDVDVNYTTIDYAFLQNNQTVSVLAAGVTQTSFTGVVGDVLRIERVGSTIYFKKNGTSMYSIASGYLTSLIADASIYTNGAAIANAQTSFWIPFQQGLVPDQQEFSALKIVYDSLGGSSWVAKTNWPVAGSWPTSATSAQFGTWYGVTVVNNDVNALNLPSNGLTGNIPGSLSKLSALVTLKLSGNAITGKIPSALGNLTNLTLLWLWQNQLTGPIPTSFSNLVNLQSLLLKVNNLSGTIPASLSNLTQLYELDLSTNQLTGSIPSSLGSMSSLAALTLSSNKLSGSIPSSLSSLTNLTKLSLDNNTLSGTIPSSLGSLPNLSSLILTTNQLTGSIPSTLGNISSLTYLALDANQLSGSIPASLGNLNKLTGLILSGNKLTGSIPPSLGNLTNLGSLYIDNNQLTGAIPDDLGNLTKMWAFVASVNQLSGQIPRSFGKLTSLMYLYLWTNQLTGALPKELSNCIGLRDLAVQSNKLSVLEPISPLNGLNGLHLQYNNFTGVVPSWIGQMPAMQNLVLNNNNFSGNLPSSLSNLTILFGLSLQNNQITGTLPDMTNFTQLYAIDVSNNKMSGAIPASIGSCKKLATFTAYNNQFTSIPASILTLPALTLVHTYGNALTSIPNFANHVNKANLTLTVYNNQIDFSQITPLVSAGLKALAYNPQNTIHDIKSVTFNVNGALTIPSRPVDATTTITWEKQQANGTWASVNATNNDATQKTFLRSSAQATDEGTYHWIMTNTAVPGFSLTSDPITVTILARAALNQWAFQYQYDGRRRMIAKRVPGADWVYMVYDDRDRLVLTQDGNQRANNQWAFTKYDQLNRPILNGIRDTSVSLTQAQMQAVVNAHYLKPSSKWGESFVGYTGTDVHGYSNYSYPVRTGSVAGEVDPSKYLTVTYYDNYAFISGDDVGTDQYVPSDVTPQTVGTITYSQPSTSNTNVIGQVTGTKVKAMDTYIYWLKSVNYYDDKYRVVQSIADHQRVGQQRTTNVYDFVGKVLASKSTTITQGPTWQNKINVIASGNQVTTNAACCWTAGSSSVQQLAAGQDGWVEAIVVKRIGANDVVFGFSQSDPDVNYTSINFGWMQTNQNAYVYENGVMKFQAPGLSVPGDVLRVERTGSVIKYKKNGVVLYNSLTASTSSLLVDNSLYYSSSTLLNPRSSFSTSSNSVYRTFTYDHAGRLLQTWHSLNGATPVQLVSNSYNELGQLVTKSLYKSGNAYKQNVDYAYNIRGWLTRINDSDLSSASNKAENGNSALPDLFGMNLLYDQKDNGLNNFQQYNGNISAVKWSNNLSLSSTKNFAYNYGYDTLNRIKSAAYLTNPGVWTSSNKFAENGFKYDLNGNIKTLARTDANGAQMDLLAYDYTNSGNQLRSVTDAGDMVNGFFDDNTSGDDYSYDANGNMIVDKNKNITAIAYNHLNLPQQVTKSTAENIRYIYDAGGRKLTQKVYNASNILTKSTDYVGEYIYQNDTLQFVNHEEGRIVMKPLTPGENGVRPEYQFHLKDHLGNVRTTFTTARNVDTPVATFEPANQTLEQSQFLRYDDARVVNASIFDHTHIANPGTTATYSQRLSGSVNEKLGVARSISVMPGDTINMEVYAKYVDPANVDPALGQSLLALVANAKAGAAGVVIDGANYTVNGITPFPFPTPVVHNHDDATAPKAYLNYLVFDRNFLPIDGGYVQMHGGASGREDGTNVTHDYLQQQLIIKQAGYVYIYLSNDEPAGKEVYFDDFKVQQIKSPVVQQEDFYPFGLTFNSYQRENSVPNKYLFQEKELQTDLGLNLEDFEWRLFDPSIVRTTTMDPHVDLHEEVSPYSFLDNNPSNTDPDGMDTDSNTGKPVDASTFVKPDGTILDHRDDGDNRIFRVDDEKAWRNNGEQKDGLKIVGEENPGYNYVPGQKINFRDRNQVLPYMSPGNADPDYTIESFVIPFARPIGWGLSWMGNVFVRLVNKGGKWIYEIVEVGTGKVLQKIAAKSVTLPKIGIKYFDDIADLSNVTKNQLVSYSKQLESLYKNGSIGALTRDQAALLVKRARKLGIEVRIDKGHPGTFWNMDHLNIGPSGYHVPILSK